MGNAIINHVEDAPQSSRNRRRPYALLAAAILKRGILENDQKFLKSDWADMLRELASSCDCSLAQDPKQQINPRGGAQ